MPTNLGPLTTFTPPSSCLNDIYRYPGPNLRCGTGGTDTCYYKQLGPLSATECYPSNFTVNPTASYFYSPGVCPTGYNSACSHLVVIDTSTQTRVTCCPSNYHCQTDVNSIPWRSTDMCTRDFPSTSTYLVTDPTPGNTKVLTSTGGGANAYGLEIRFGAPVETGATLPPSVSATSTSSSSTGLSTGAKAGIGVGVGIGGLLVLLTAVFLFLRSRRSRDHPRQDEDLDEGQATNHRPEYKAELPAAQNNRVLPAELSASPAEMATESHHAELEGKSGHGGGLQGSEPAELGT